MKMNLAILKSALELAVAPAAGAAPALVAAPARLMSPDPVSAAAGEKQDRRQAHGSARRPWLTGRGGGFVVAALLALFAVFGAVRDAGAAIGVGTPTSDSGTGATINVTHTVSGTDRLMLVGISTAGAVSGLTIISVVWDPTGVDEALTLVGSQTQSAGDAKMWIYQKLAPTTGTNTLRVRFSSGLKAKVVGVVSFTGVDQSTPLGTFVSAQGLSNSASVSVTSATGELVFDTVAVEDAASMTVGANQTQLWNLQSGATLGGGSTEAGAASVTMSWSPSSSEKWAIGAVPIKPAAGAPAAGGFNAYETSTAAGAITGVIKTKIAGSTISLDMIALNAAKTAIETTFTGTVRVEVLNASDNSGAPDGNGCRPTWTVIQTLSPDPAFTDGRDPISFTQADSYPDARLKIYFPVTSPTVIGCSNDNFAIRPNTLASFAVTDTDWQTAGTGRTLDDVTFIVPPPGGAGKVHKAGRPLSVRATAVNAAGTPATTTNYAGAPTATLTACVGAACTATFGALTLTTTFVAGQLASDVASYNNVGSYQLQLVDSTFASVDAGDGSTTTERDITSAVINVGRFVPDHFAVSLNTPVFGTACGSFTYIGQAFNYTTAPVITVTAQDFANNTATLYNTIGSWWRITNADITPATQGARYSAATGTLGVTGLPAVGTDPVIASSGAGVGTLTFSSGTGLLFTRTTPVAPFDADISLALNVIDTDGVVASNPVTFGAASAGNGIAFSSGKQMRFGRLRLTNAFGSSLLDLPLPLSTQYYDGNVFATNTLDSCTTLSASDIAFGFLGSTPNLIACETHLNPAGAIAFASGKATVRLTKPGNNNDGAVDLTVNLGAVASGITCTSATSSAATAANKTWLQGNWGSGSYSDDPRGRATFGIFKNADQFLYFREVY
jgi:MSHA biogenesis protein MshQ